MTKSDSFAQKTICPSCGGNMKWDPQSMKLKCEFCGTLVEVPIIRSDIPIHSIDESPAEVICKQHKPIVCESCGAKMLFYKNETVSKCAYCGASYILETSKVYGDLVESILPFRITEEQAEKSILELMKKHARLRRALKKNRLNIEGIEASYTPYWIFDTYVECVYQGREGHEHIRHIPTIRRVNKQTVFTLEKEIETRWEYTKGQVNTQINTIMIPAKENPTDVVQQGLSDEFNVGKLVKYNPLFLAGLKGEEATIDLKTAWSFAIPIIEKKMKQLAIKDIKTRADDAEVSTMDNSYSNTYWRLVFLPRYICNYEYKNKRHQIIINGDTGAIKGKIPDFSYEAFGGIAIMIYCLLMLIVYMLLLRH